MLTKEQAAQYLQRIDYKGVLTANKSVLSSLQWAHLTHIPYENLNIPAGIPLSLKPHDLFDKIVTDRRGGYCFEKDDFFVWVLMQKEREKDWKPMYGFTEEIQVDDDFVMPSFYCEKHPDSTFNKFMKISIFQGESNFTPVDGVFKEYRSAEVKYQKRLTEPKEIREILNRYFGLENPICIPPR